METQHAPFLRDSWQKRRVHLWNANISKRLGEAVVLLVHPYEAINFKELGDSHLGVIIDKPLHPTPKSPLNYSDLPQLSLIPWPIKKITFKSGECINLSDGNVNLCENI